MSAYYLHDGRNEIGPFTIDLLKQQKLTRNTPIRKLGTDSWMPAERLAPLKELVVPRKIRRPKDVIPAVREHFTDLQRRKPRTLYTLLFLFFLLAGVSLYTVTRIVIIKEPAQAGVAASQVTITSGPTAAAVTAVEKPKAEEKAAPVEEDKAKTTRLRWNKLITASNSNYGIGFLGGIKDLSVVLTNRTNFPIDVAIVKVSYLKPNGSDSASTGIVLFSCEISHCTTLENLQLPLKIFALLNLEAGPVEKHQSFKQALLEHYKYQSCPIYEGLGLDMEAVEKKIRIKAACTAPEEAGTQTRQ